MKATTHFSCTRRSQQVTNIRSCPFFSLQLYKTMPSSTLIASFSLPSSPLSCCSALLLPLHSQKKMSYTPKIACDLTLPNPQIVSNRGLASLCDGEHPECVGRHGAPYGAATAASSARDATAHCQRHVAQACCTFFLYVLTARADRPFFSAEPPQARRHEEARCCSVAAVAASRADAQADEVPHAAAQGPQGGPRGRQEVRRDSPRGRSRC